MCARTGEKKVPRREGSELDIEGSSGHETSEPLLRSTPHGRVSVGGVAVSKGFLSGFRRRSDWLERGASCQR